jgi:hypothetical protein
MTKTLEFIENFKRASELFESIRRRPCFPHHLKKGGNAHNQRATIEKGLVERAETKIKIEETTLPRARYLAFHALRSSEG